MAVSPSILVREFEFSEFGAALGLARPVFIGGASKGPLNTPTVARTAAELIEKFGPPLLTDYGIISAIQYFAQGDNLMYLRVSDGTDDIADRTIAGTSGGTAAVAATGTIVFTLSTNPADGETITIRDGQDATHATTMVTFVGNVNPDDGDTLTLFDGTNTIVFEFDNNSSVVESGTLRQVVIGATAAVTRDNLIAKINAHVALLITAADSTLTDPRVTLTADQSGTAGNSYTAVMNSGPLVVSASPFTGGTNGTAYIFEFDNNSSVGPGNIGVLIGATAAATLANLISAINASALTITAEDTTTTVPEATLTNDVAGLDGNQAMSETGAQITVTGMSGGTDAIPGAATNVMTVFAKSSGSWGNYISVQFRPTTVFGAPAGNFDMLIYAPPAEKPLEAAVLQEVYQNLSLTSTSARYIEKVVETGVVGETVPSAYVVVDVLSTGTPNTGTFQLGTGGGTPGTDGISALASTDYIGTYAGQNSTGLQVLRNADRHEFNILAVPGNSHADVIAEMIDVCTDRGDALALIDPPFGLTPDQIIDWHNGLGAAHSIPNSPTTGLDSSFAALYWSWQRTFDQTNAELVWLPPSPFVAANMSANDRTAGPWFAVAGFVRGITDSLEAEYSPDLSERDELVGEGSGNRINPLVEFPTFDAAATIFGNKTLQRTEGPLTSVHIRRMLLHAKKLCASAVKVLVFDPNDPVSWKRFEQFCNPILEEIRSRRGLEQFSVTCNATTNPPAQRAQKIMRGIITLKAIDAAERIIMDFAVLSTGTDFTEAVLAS